ncbi:MAG TPA: hypothetical protein VI479_18310 [Blastocatellia bacterium]
MLVRDPMTGRLHEIPDHLQGAYLGEYGRLYEPQWGEYPQGYGYSPQRVASRVVYDGFGNPVGILPIVAALAPIAGKVLPGLAKKFLPGLARKFLPKLVRKLPGGAQRLLPMITQAAPAVSDYLQGAPSECRCVRRRRRRIAVPPPPVPPLPPVMERSGEAGSAEPPGAVHGWGYYGGFNSYGQW